MTHIYRPIDWQERLGYRVHLTLRNGNPRCRASVKEPRVGFHQCNKPGFVEADGVWLCKVHDPKAAAERDRAAKAKSDAAWEKRMLEFSGPRFAKALKAIADGHNDPRSLALETLGDLYGKLP